MFKRVMDNYLKKQKEVRKSWEVPLPIEEAVLENIRVFPSSWVIERIEDLLLRSHVVMINENKKLEICSEGHFYIKGTLPSDFNGNFISDKGMDQLKPYFEEFLKLEVLQKEVGLIKATFEIVDYIKKYI